jgi:2'-hydroxyisoflavone reductase
VELIDARDLAAWVVRMAEGWETGVYNAAGPEHVLTMERMLEDCREALCGTGRFTWVPDHFLDEQGAAPPFWYPEEEFGCDLADNTRAVAKGLTFRPLADTIRDVHAWVSEDPESRDNYDFPRERETDLLSLWNH